MTALSTFLSENKKKFIEDVVKDGGKDWTIVMGNEAGDLDTIASSVAYSYLSQRQTNHPTIALIQMHRADLFLRPENLLAFQFAHLSPSHDDLFMLDDLPVPTKSLKTTFALVDHNQLGPEFNGTVVGVIDHHVDEGLYPNANPRDIVLVGSATSLVARHFKDAWKSLDPPPPPEVATLLLSAIFIDTGGLKPKGKAEQIDRDSADFLLPVSTFAPSYVHPEGSIHSSSESPSIAQITDQLSTQKADVSHLDSRDLFRRDYKEYVSGTPPVRVGLSTVPLGPKPWLEKDPELGKALDAWAEERKLDVAGILVTYRTEKKNKKRRGIILWVRKGEEALAKKLEKGLEKNKELDLDPVKGAMGLAEAGRRVKVWDQLNTDATRKVIAPAILAILEA